MVKIHPIQTGRVRVRDAQVKRKTGGLLRVLLDRNWTDWLPILAWVIEHPEGLIVVDTGETARATQAGYFPRWHPYYQLACRMDVEPEQEIGPQLRRLGFDPAQVTTVVLTHLHTDHAGGLHHFEKSRVLVEEGEYQSAQGLMGKMAGYLPHRWPAWFAPTFIPFRAKPHGPFAESYALTRAGDVVVVPTPGHTPTHVSVIVKVNGLSYFLAGDTSYTEALLAARTPDGVSPIRKQAVDTLTTILDYAREEPTVYLPSHDPGATDRLRAKHMLRLGPAS